MVMFPSPKTGVFFRFDKIARLVLFGVHERDVAFVLFGLFVHERENTARARKTHGDHGDLLGHLVDDLREVPRHTEECDNNTD